MAPGLSISQSAQLLGFSRTTISRVYKESCEKVKTSSMWQSCGQKCLVVARDQRRMGQLIQDRRATLTFLTILTTLTTLTIYPKAYL